MNQISISITISGLNPEQTALIAALTQGFEKGTKLSAGPRPSTEAPSEPPATRSNGTANGNGAPLGGHGGVVSRAMANAEAEPARRGPPPPRVDDEAVAAAAATSKPREPAKPKTTKGGKATEEPEEKPAPRASETRRTAPADDADEDMLPAEPRRKAAKAAPAPEPEAEEVEEDEAPADDAGDAFADCKKVGDVIEVMIRQGLDEDEDIIAECIRMKGAIPLLLRISDIRDRVSRTIPLVRRAMEAS